MNSASLKAAQALGDIGRLARQPKTAVIAICGNNAAGKTTLAEALASKAELHAAHIELDFWKTKSTAERRSILERAQRQGAREVVAYWSDDINHINWNKFNRDFNALLQTGALALENIYTKTTGELTGRSSLRLADQPSRLIILEGTTLLHPTIRKRADYVIYLNMPEETLKARRAQRDGHRKTEVQLQADNARLQKWGTRYFNRYAQAVDIELNERDLQDLHSLIKAGIQPYLHTARTAPPALPTCEKK